MLELHGFMDEHLKCFKLGGAMCKDEEGWASELDYLLDDFAVATAVSHGQNA